MACRWCDRIGKEILAWSFAPLRRCVCHCASPKPAPAAKGNLGPRCRDVLPGNARCASGLRIQGEQGVGKQVVAYTIGAVEIEYRRSGWHIHNAAFVIQCHSGPIIGGAGFSPGIFRPRIVAEFARMRDGMKSPSQFSGANVEGSNISRRGRMSFGIAAAHDNQIFVDNARDWSARKIATGSRHGDLFVDRVFHILQTSLSACRSERPAAYKKIRDGGENPAFFAISPIGKASHRIFACEAGIKLPDQVAGCGVDAQSLFGLRCMHRVHGRQRSGWSPDRPLPRRQISMQSVALAHFYD